MDNVGNLKVLVDAYGVAVRAGVITPQREDEVALRAIFELPVMSAGVEADWAESGGIRKPITIQTTDDEPAVRDEGSGDE